jgi:hypothetical protein
MRPLALAIVMPTVAGDAPSFLTPIAGKQSGLSSTAVGALVSAFAAGSLLDRLPSRLFVRSCRSGNISAWRWSRALAIT